MAASSLTRPRLQRLRLACRRLVGAVCSYAGSAGPGKTLHAWLTALILLGSPVLPPGAAAAETAGPPPAPSVTVPFSAAQAARLAPWQQRLTLGPGDVLDVSLHGQADSLRNALIVGPDGQLSYLEAQDVAAAGLTIDELRARLEEVLAKFHLSPRVVITPVAYNSKKFFLLGSVQQVGAYSLSRPVHVLEAVARAGGFVTSAQYRNALVQADLSRSFLARKQPDGATNRVAVDFEALFLRGDLSQNQALAPGDYLFFPPLDVQEVYVLGAVGMPGVVPYTKDMTTVGAIVARGGFAERAQRSKVLIVRGSLTAPQKILVDVNAVLTAREKDFPLQNKDIVYVSRRPTAKLEELTESAITSFVNGMIWGYTQSKIIPNLPY